MAEAQLADVLSSPVRRLLVDFLSNPPEVAVGGSPDVAPGGVGPVPRSAKEIAEHLGVHVTTARFHLDLLVEAGIVEARSVRSGVGRPRKMYSIRPGSLRSASTEASFQHLATLLADTIADPQNKSPEEAGVAWGRSAGAKQAGTAEPTPARSSGQWIGKIGQMVDVLQDFGYTPEVSLAGDGRTARVTLRDCPFLGLAGKHPDVVCGIHRGLIRGALEALGEDDTEVGLEPFVGPTLCLAHLRTRAPFDRDQGQARPSTAATTDFF